MGKPGANQIDSLGLGVYLRSVGVERFELSTSRTRTVRSTGLSHTPICNIPLRGKRANYTIAICFRKLWVKQYHLAIEIEQARHPVVILSDG
jgi:hypothetical protein